MGGRLGVDSLGKFTLAGVPTTPAAPYVHQRPPLRVVGAQVATGVVVPAVAAPRAPALTGAVAAAFTASGVVTPSITGGIVFKVDDEVVGAFKSDGTLV